MAFTGHISPGAVEQTHAEIRPHPVPGGLGDVARLTVKGEKLKAGGTGGQIRRHRSRKTRTR